MKILLLGKNGQVGWELQRALAPLGDLLALDRAESSHCGDLTRPDDLLRGIRAFGPDVIVNAAAYTAVDRAERESELAHAVNAIAPGVIAREASATGAWLVHYSTDYVFDGTGSRPWLEESPTGPLSVYGHSKLEGEELIRASGCKHLIFRASWVYATRGSNFAKTMLRLSQERERLSVVSDQFGAPTGAELLADVTSIALRAARAMPNVSGTYHVAAQGETSWHGYAKHVIEFARRAGHPVCVAPDAIDAITSRDFSTPARRPANSRLDTNKLRRTFDITLPDWHIGVDRALSEVLGL